MAAAAYPDVHPEAASPEDDLKYLREKCEAGVDFLITQMCFDGDVIGKFVGKCRERGIVVPILVAVYAPWSYEELRRMCAICRVRMSAKQFGEYEQLRNDPDGFRRFGRQQCVAFCRKVLGVDGVAGIHFFTLNRSELVRAVVKDVWG